jgi:hypothetical protein
MPPPPSSRGASPAFAAAEAKVVHDVHIHVRVLFDAKAT